MEKIYKQVNEYDLSYPLFWACEHGSLETVEILLNNGALYKPHNNNDGISVSIILKC